MEYLMTTETGHTYNGESPVSGLTPAEKRRWMEGRYVHQKLEKDAQKQARQSRGGSDHSFDGEYDVEQSRREWRNSFSENTGAKSWS